MIHHVLPNKLHHTPGMIELLVARHREIGVSPDEQVFWIYGMPRKDEPAYTQLGIPSDRLAFSRRKILGVGLLARIRDGDLLVLHSGFARLLWLWLLARPSLWRRAALLLWGAELVTYHREWERARVLASAVAWMNPARLRLAARRFSSPRQLEPRAAAATGAGAAGGNGRGRHGVTRTALVARVTLRRLVQQVVATVERSARRFVLPRLGAVCVGTPGELLALRECQGACPNAVTFVFNTNTSSGEPAAFHPRGERARVLLAHSGHVSNGHLEALAWLGRFRDEAMQVFCPLAYPARSPYMDDVIARGVSLFGDARFTPLLDLAPRQEYNTLLQSIDILILNAPMQQGLYHVFSFVSNGKKVYLSPVSPVYEMLIDWGIRVFDVGEIASASFDDFRSFHPEDARANRQIARTRLSVEATLDHWRRLIAGLKAAAVTGRASQAGGTLR